MIEAVTFDWWFTIVNLPMPFSEYAPWARKVRIDGLQEVLTASGWKVETDRLSEAYDLFARQVEDAWSKNIDLSGEEQVALFLQFAKLQKISDRDLLRKLQEPFGRVLYERPPILNDGIKDCLKQVKEDGYRVALISNTGRSWGRYLRDVQKKFGIFDFFDVLTFSDEIGIRKPNPAIFTNTLKKLKVSPELSVHIGDDVDTDITGAKSVGMKAIWYNAGIWPDTKCDNADGEINHFKDLPEKIKRL